MLNKHSKKVIRVKPKRNKRPMCIRCNTRPIAKQARKYCKQCRPIAEAEHVLKTIERSRTYQKNLTDLEREAHKDRQQAHWERVKRLSHAIKDMTPEQVLFFIGFHELEPLDCHIETALTKGEVIRQIPERPRRELLEEYIIEKYTKKGTLKDEGMRS